MKPILLLLLVAVGAWAGEIKLCPDAIIYRRLGAIVTSVDEDKRRCIVGVGADYLGGPEVRFKYQTASESPFLKGRKYMILLIDKDKSCGCGHETFFSVVNFDVTKMRKDTRSTAVFYDFESAKYWPIFHLSFNFEDPVVLDLSIHGNYAVYVCEEKADGGGK